MIVINVLFVVTIVTKIITAITFIIILSAFLELCAKVGGEVAVLGPMVDKAFKVLMIIKLLLLRKIKMFLLMKIKMLDEEENVRATKASFVISLIGVSNTLGR